MSKANTQKNKSQSLPPEELTGTDETVEGAAPAEKPSKKVRYGNKDKDKKYELGALGIVVPKGHYLVRHFSSVSLANGQSMEDPTTSRFQVYDAKTYENMTKQTIKNGIQQKSDFEDLGLNVDILHEPE